MGNIVFHHCGCTSIYRSLPYPLRSKDKSIPGTYHTYAASGHYVLSRVHTDQICLRTWHHTCHNDMAYHQDELSREPETNNLKTLSKSVYI